MAAKASEPRFALREVMEKVGMSQRKLCRLLDRPPQHVRRYFRGMVEIGWRNACLIAKAMKLPIGVFRPGDPAYKEFFKERTVEA